MNQKEKGDLIGYDPLAWLSQDEATAPASQRLPVEPPNSDAGEHNSDALQEHSSISLEQAAQIILKTTQNLQTISGLQTQLIDILENTSGAIAIDASAVKSIDTATLQLLIAFKQEAVRSNRGVQFDFPSEKFLEAAELLGLSSLLALDNLAAGLF